MKVQEFGITSICSYFDMNLFADKAPHYVVIERRGLLYVLYRNMSEDVAILTFPTLRSISKEDLMSEVGNVFTFSIPDSVQNVSADDSIQSSLSKLEASDKNRVLGRLNARSRLSENEAYVELENFARHFRNDLFVYPFDKTKLCVKLYSNTDDTLYVNLAIFGNSHTYFNTELSAYNIFHNQKESNSLIFGTDMPSLLKVTNETKNLAIVSSVNQSIFNRIEKFRAANQIQEIVLPFGNRTRSQNIAALTYFIMVANSRLPNMEVTCSEEGGVFRIYIQVLKSAHEPLGFIQLTCSLNKYLRSKIFGKEYKVNPDYMNASGSFEKYLYSRSSFDVSDEYISYELSFIPLKQSILCLIEHFDLLFEAAPKNNSEKDTLSFIKIIDLEEYE